jgi:tetratricopeptide (TPR) repeat protein
MSRLRGAAFLALAALAAGAGAQEPAPAPRSRPALPFVEDDYGKALADARARNLPLFVEAWAPWCHTCRSMRAYVFTDRALSGRARQFVWLSIDTDKKGSAPFLAKFPVEAWPTFFVVDPRTEEAVLRFVGGASVGQLQKLLDEARREIRGKEKEKGLEEALARADRLYAEGKNREAAALYRDALGRAPSGWKPYARAVESLLFALQKSDEHALCAQTSRDAFPKLAASTSAANVAAMGLDCALAMPAGDASRAPLVAGLVADARKVIARPAAGIAADDISSLYGALSDERKDAADPEGRIRVLNEWVAYLEVQAAKAKTPEERAVFDPHRLSVYLALGEPGRAIPMLEASEDDFPEDYNPPARRALALEALQQYDVALVANDKALSLAYGPRLIRVLTDRSRICVEKGDLVSARIALQEALREARALPEGQRSDVQIADVQKRLDALPQ